MDFYGGEEEESSIKNPIVIGSILLGVFVIIGIIVAILIGLGYFESVPLSTSDPLSKYNSRAKWDWEGNDISCGKYINVSDAANACSADPACKGFSTTADINKPWCLKNQLSGLGSANLDQAMFYIKK